MKRLNPLLLSCLLSVCIPLSAAPTYGCKVIARYPHLTSSYTEGFFFKNGLFYEGTGLKGHSQILVYQPDGKLLHHFDYQPQYFGEGIIDWGPNLLAWTWQSHTGFVLDRDSLRPIRGFQYTGEGWGMTRNDHEIITSDGSPILRFRNPDTFDPTHQITVRDGMTPVRNLNELEYIPDHKGGGEIYANVWHTDRIARISPADGHVIAWIDCAGLLPAAQRPADPEAVLNGIAYDAARDRIFVTGKQWPTIFEIKAIPLSRPTK